MFLNIQNATVSLFSYGMVRSSVLKTWRDLVKQADPTEHFQAQSTAKQVCLAAGMLREIALSAGRTRATINKALQNICN